MHVQIKRFVYAAWLFVVCSILVASISACGGGGGGSATVPPPPREPGIRQFVGAFGESTATSGFVDGAGSQAKFSDPGNIAADQLGNLYVADRSNKALRKVTAAGVVTTVARPAGASVPVGAAVDTSSNLYLVDGTNKVQKITPAGAETTLVLPPDQLYAGAIGARTATVASDKNGNIYLAFEAWRTVDLYCSSYGPPRYCERIYKATLHKVSPSGAWVTVATSDDIYRTADGNGHLADFLFAGGIAVDGAGTLYASDVVNHAIIKITAAGVVTTLAGTPGVAGAADGLGAAASFRSPSALAVDAAGNVYVYDVENHTIRKITPSGSVTTVAGTIGKSELAFGSLPGSLSWGAGLAIAANGDLVLSVQNGLITITLP